MVDCQIVQLHFWQFSALMVKLQSSNNGNLMKATITKNLKTADNFISEDPTLPYTTSPTTSAQQSTMSEGPKPWWWLWSPCRGEQVEGSGVGGGGGGGGGGVGAHKIQDCRIYANSQGYTPLGHLLVLLVFILSLVVIFGLMWYFVSIFSLSLSPSLFDILGHFSSLIL